MAARITEEDILHWTRSLAWSGEYIEDEVPLLIEDQLDDDRLDRNEIIATIRRAWREVFAVDQDEQINTLILAN